MFRIPLHTHRVASNCPWITLFTFETWVLKLVSFPILIPWKWLRVHQSWIGLWCQDKRIGLWCHEERTGPMLLKKEQTCAACKNESPCGKARKSKHYTVLCGELALEEAMDLCKTGTNNSDMQLNNTQNALLPFYCNNGYTNARKYCAKRTCLYCYTLISLNRTQPSGFRV